MTGLLYNEHSTYGAYAGVFTTFELIDSLCSAAIAVRWRKRGVLAECGTTITARWRKYDEVTECGTTITTRWQKCDEIAKQGAADRPLFCNGPATVRMRYCDC